MGLKNDRCAPLPFPSLRCIEIQEVRVFKFLAEDLGQTGQDLPSLTVKDKHTCGKHLGLLF